VKQEERAASERSYNGIAKTLGAGSAVECRALQLDNCANIGIFAPHVGWWSGTHSARIPKVNAGNMYAPDLSCGLVLRSSRRYREFVAS